MHGVVAASAPAPLDAAAATSGINNTNSVAASPALATAVQSAASVPASAVSRPTGPQIVPTNFTTDYLAGKTMQVALQFFTPVSMDHFPSNWLRLSSERLAKPAMLGTCSAG